MTDLDCMGGIVSPDVLNEINQKSESELKSYLCWIDPLAHAGKVEVPSVQCSECGHDWKIIVGEQTTVGELECYVCRDCRPPIEQMKTSPEMFNGFDVFKETFIK